VVVNVQQCISLDMGMLSLHNDIFLTDTMDYDRLKFSCIYTIITIIINFFANNIKQ